MVSGCCCGRRMSGNPSPEGLCMMTRGSTPKKNIKPSRINRPRIPMPPPRPAPPPPPGKRTPPGKGKPTRPPSPRRSSTFWLSLSPRHRIFASPKFGSQEPYRNCPPFMHGTGFRTRPGGPWRVFRHPSSGMRGIAQILVVKSEIDTKPSKNCHRQEAICTRPVVSRLGGSAFCVMRTSLGNPRAGALLFWAASPAATWRRMPVRWRS